MDHGDPGTPGRRREPGGVGQQVHLTGRLGQLWQHRGGTDHPLLQLDQEEGGPGRVDALSERRGRHRGRVLTLAVGAAGCPGPHVDRVGTEL